MENTQNNMAVKSAVENVREYQYKVALETITSLTKGSKSDYGFFISYELDIDSKSIRRFYIVSKNKTWSIMSDITIPEMEAMLNFMKKKVSESKA